MAVSLSGRQRSETWLSNHHCGGQWSTWSEMLSTVVQFLSPLDSNRMQGSKQGQPQQVESADSVSTEAWPVGCDACASIGQTYFCPMFVSLIALTPNHVLPTLMHINKFHVCATAVIHTHGKSNCFLTSCTTATDDWTNACAHSSHRSGVFHTYI